MPPAYPQIFERRDIVEHARDRLRARRKRALTPQSGASYRAAP